MKLQTAKLFWKDLVISPKELRLDTLRCGQSFRWKQVNGHWASVLHGRLVVLKETPATILYGYDKDLDEKAILEIRDYFQLDKVSLEKCYKDWSKIDSNFSKKSIHFAGIRILRQDPWENLISFICSSNNNITRISQMIDKLCKRFGKKVGTLDETEFYDFPTLDQFVSHDHTESTLRELGFGYRAKYIANTAKMIKSDHAPLGELWLHTLRSVTYPEAKASLMQLQGVGPKVADCVCLMSLDHSEAIPVDTHVWQIALRDYGFNKRGKTLTSQLYIQVGDHFRSLFGKYAGWAHSVLFTADLKSFSPQKRKLEDVKLEEKREILKTP
ncbi:DNA glycosylase [Mucor mucedo]|uniref:DNA glycosylase n=1 Tax=Mucor mucedo TaxID=29922 RepID=UPI002220D33F|nr:DNA glycosylase [Mucor mucedo]KAI7869265.1 DNA glycosylase [Mucor mucedo]